MTEGNGSFLCHDIGGCIWRGGTYFFTVTLADRRSRLLVSEIDRLRRAFARVKAKQPFEIVAACVLPNHLHTVWTLPPGDSDYSSRWAKIKRLFSAGLMADARRSGSKVAKREKGIWQRRFWEHCVTDARDLENCVDYTHFNPVRHGLVEKVADWPYSTFHRYVANGWLKPNWGT